MHFYEPAILSGKYKSLVYTENISTTDIINRITSRSSDELTRKYFLKEQKIKKDDENVR